MVTLKSAENALNGWQKRGANSFPLHGVRTPELKRNPPKAWSSPEPLFQLARIAPAGIPSATLP
jgi:hypothetical protein